MNKFKKLLSSFMAAAMLLSAAPLGGFAEIDLPDFSGIKVFAVDETHEWIFNEETGTLTIGADVSNYDFIEELISTDKKVKTIHLEEGNTSFKLINGILYDSSVETLLIYPTASDKKEYIMPDSVKSILNINGNFYSPFSAENLETLKIGANFFVKTYQEAVTFVEEQANLLFTNDFFKFPSPDSEAGKVLYATMIGILLPKYTADFASLDHSKYSRITNFYVSESNPLFFSKNGILYLRYNGFDMLIRQVVSHVDTVTLDANTVICNQMPFLNSKANEVVITDEFIEKTIDYQMILNSIDEDEKASDFLIKKYSAQSLPGYFRGFLVKEIKISDSSTYYTIENGILYTKDKTILCLLPADTDKAFIQISEVEYVTTGSFIIISNANYTNLTLHIPNCFLDGTTKVLEFDEPLTEDKFIIELLGLTADKICIENENEFISYFGMTVEQWNEKTKAEQENALNEFNAYKEAYEKGGISKSEFIEYQEAYDNFVKSACFYEICGGKHNIIKDFAIEEIENTEVKFGESITLTANLGDASLPEGCKVEWTVDGTGAEITVSEDMLSCAVKCVDSGEVTVTAKVIDSEGNTVTDEYGKDAVDSQTLTMNANFFVRVAAFFKYLWNLIVSLFK